MKLKYYLRGLGTGIIVTALILGLTGRQQEKLSDAQIKERAKQLGMVEQTVLSDLQQETEQASTEEESLASEEETEETPSMETISTETAEAETETVQPESELAESEAEDEEEAVSEKETEEERDVANLAKEEAEKEEASIEAAKQEAEEAKVQEQATETVRISVRSGDSSWPVSKKVQAAGLVSDARAFDDFLCDNGYSRFLRAGEYDIPVGASEEEIAKILARR